MKIASRKRQLAGRLLGGMLALTLALASLFSFAGPVETRVEREAARTLDVLNWTQDNAPKFRVPELIYLSPADSKTLRYFYGADSDGKANPAPHTLTRSEQIRADFPAEAGTVTGLRLTVAALQDPNDWTSTTTTGTNRLANITVANVNRTGTAADSTGWPLTPGFASSVTAGAFLNAVQGNGNVVLRWTFSYNLDGQPLKSYAYTLCFATRTGREYVNGSTASTYNGPTISIWAAGTHTDGVVAVSGDSPVFVGYYKDDPLIESSRFTQTTNPTFELPSSGKVHLTYHNSFEDGQTAGNQPNNPIDMYNGGTRFSGFWRGNNTTPIRLMRPANGYSIDGGEGVLTVDISRFNNSNQIPTLMVGVDMHHNSSYDAKFVEYLERWQASAGYQTSQPGHNTGTGNGPGSDWVGSTADGVASWLTSGGTPNTGSYNSNQWSASQTSALRAVRLMTNNRQTHDGDGGSGKGYRWYGAMNHDFTSTGNETLSAQARSIGDRAGNTTLVYVSTYVTFNKVDKTALRTAYYQSLDSFYPQTVHSGGHFDNYQNSMLNALVRLTNPLDATVDPSIVPQKPSSTATAVHKNLTHTTLNSGVMTPDGTASEPYKYGDVVSGNFNDYPGYSNTSWSVTGDYNLLDWASYLKTINPSDGPVPTTPTDSGTATVNHANQTVQLYRTAAADDHFTDHTKIFSGLDPAKTYKIALKVQLTDDAARTVPVEGASNFLRCFVFPNNEIVSSDPEHLGENAMLVGNNSTDWPVFQELGGGWYQAETRAINFATCYYCGNPYTIDYTSLYIRLGLFGPDGTEKYATFSEAYLVDTSVNSTPGDSGAIDLAAAGRVSGDPMDATTPKAAKIANADFDNIAFEFEYTANEYTATYTLAGAENAKFADDSTDDMVVPNITYDGPHTPPEEPERIGYTFQKWVDGTTELDAEVEITWTGAAAEGEGFASDRTFRADWTPEEYTITYNGNGNTAGATAPQTVEYGTFPTLRTNAFTKTGHGFVGWNTQEDGLGTRYGNGGSYGKWERYGESGDLTLYAMWEPTAWTITYDGNMPAAAVGPVTGVPEDDGKVHGEDYMPIMEPPPALTGYTFLGWDEDDDATTPTYPYPPDENDPVLYDVEADMDLYAIWTETTYTVTYDDNHDDEDDYTAGPGSDTKYYFTDLTLSLDEPEREGYTFLGWAEEDEAPAPDYLPGDIYTDNDDVTLYAVWELNTYTIEYDGNKPAAAAGLVDDVPANGTKNHFDPYDPYESVDPLPSLAGYIFLGWAEEDDATTPDYPYPADENDPALYEDEDDTILYAIWEIETYTVTYDANGGNFGEDTELPPNLILIIEDTKTYGIDMTLSDEVPDRDHYTFLGWAEEDDATTPTYTNPPTPDGYTDNADLTLYAVWEPEAYTVTYDDNHDDIIGATLGPGSGTKYHDIALTLSSVEPTRVGYTFLGWDEDEEAEEPTYTKADAWVYAGNDDLDLFAVWEANIYNIAYNENGGTNGPTTPSKWTYGDTGMALSLTVPKRENFTFRGWAESKALADAGPAKYTMHADFPDNTTGWKYEGDLDNPDDVTLYAVWGPLEYTVTYDANGGEDAPDADTKLKDVTLPLSTDEPTYTDFVFLGWSANSGATTPDYLPGDDYTANAAVTLYAVWVPAEYTVTYNANGGEDAPASDTKAYGVDLTLSDDEPTRDHYTFLGWAEEDDATTPTYTNPPTPDGYTDNADLMLYAVWDPDEYTVSYDANGGTGEPGSGTKYHGIPLTLSSTEPTYTGYKFLGWDEDDEAETPTYTKAGTWAYAGNADVTLYAVWGPEEYKVTYNENGGTNGPGTGTKIQGVAMTLSSTEPKRQNYTFLGWNENKTAADAGTATYTKAGTWSYTGNANVTLYAVWGLEEYTVTYDANGGTGAPANDSKIYNVTLTLSSTEPTYTDFVFVGWSANSGATTPDYLAGDAYTANAAVTLYAVWVPTEYTVTYDANGGEDAPASDTKDYGVDLTLSADEPTRDHYTFLGWAEKADATVPTYTNPPVIDGYTADADVTLYAVWDPDAYTVEYDANGGTGEPADGTKYHGIPLTLSSTEPTYTGYTFLGWDEDDEAETPTYTKAGTWAYAGNAGVTLYAVWGRGPVEYKVTYNENGGTNGPGTGTKIQGVAMTLSSTEPKRQNYTFLGWNESKTAADAGTATYTKAGTWSYTGNANVTLYAVWKPDEYAVTYNANGGSGAPANGTKYHGMGLTLSSTEPTRAGYSFLGWSADSAAASPAYLAGGSYTANAAVTLYAVWKSDAYTVTYDANGGSGAPSDGTKLHGIPMALSYTYPTLANYTFLGWDTSSTATAATYEKGVNWVYDVNGDVDLYAVWKPAEYTVTYDANGGAEAPAPGAKIYNEPLTITMEEPTRAGYEFQGWATGSAGAAVVYAPGDSYTDNAALKLYAVWKLIQYQVRYAPGAGASGSLTASYGPYDYDEAFAAARVDTLGFSKPNSHFVGWKVDNAGTLFTATNLSKLSTTDGAIVTLVAQWTGETSTVTYKANGGTGAAYTNSAVYGASYQVLANNFTKQYYTFDGWNTAADGTGTSYAAGAAIASWAYGDTTLYAQWRGNPNIKYSVEYYLESPTGSYALTKSVPFSNGTAGKQSTVNPAAIASSNSLDLAQYSPDSRYANDVTLTINGNGTTAFKFYYKRDSYRLTVEKDGGTGGVNTQLEVRWGSEVALSPHSRDGWDFLGWIRGDDGSTIPSNAETLVMPQGDLLITAKWALKTYTLTFDINGITTTLEKVHDVPVKMPTDVPAREGYTFLGWSTDSAATTVEYAAGASYNANAGATFYPVWSAVKTQSNHILTTAWPDTIINWLLFFFLFGWIWMWFIKP